MEDFELTADEIEVIKSLRKRKQAEQGAVLAIQSMMNEIDKIVSRLNIDDKDDINERDILFNLRRVLERLKTDDICQHVS